MTLGELKDLKDGDQVVLKELYLGIEAGTVLTRKKSWMDDDLCVMFTFDKGDKKDFHYFNSKQVDFIKE